MYCAQCCMDHESVTGACTPRRCCPRCGSMSHDGSFTAVCPAPPWETPVIFVKPVIVDVPVLITQPEVVQAPALPAGM